MKEFVIERKDSGQRVDKYLARILPAATKSFIYKMIRKKNIVLNDKRLNGNELLKEGDSVKLWFSDETFEHFANSSVSLNVIDEFLNAYQKFKDSIEIIFEDDDFLIVNKPCGILSQKSAQSDLSLNEWIVGYLLSKEAVTVESLSVCRPSIVNRLDRNTSGLILIGKTVYGLNVLSEMVRDRLIKKYYLTYVIGFLDGEATLIGYHSKSESNNTSTIIDCDAYERLGKSHKEKYSLVKTAYSVLDHYKLSDTDITAVELDLITGKSHQIRVHMSSIGHPLLGDNKYGDTDLNIKLGLKHQLLHAYKIVFPDDERLNKLSKRTITCQHGNQEVFEALF
ncbi:MAG: RluA family pseudouridine synthase [Lachnospiraceae bacterium]|nr:RluA family pseudouridine synthase [Lachnospiraceae bacterium]